MLLYTRLCMRCSRSWLSYTLQLSFSLVCFGGAYCGESNGTSLLHFAVLVCRMLHVKMAVGWSQKVLAMCCQPPSTNAVFCSKDGECVTNNNNQTGFVTALIFSVVTEQTIGERLLKVVVTLCCCPAMPITLETTSVVLQVCSSKVCILQAMVTHIQTNAGQLHG